MPSAIRQPGPCPTLLHLAPTSNALASSGLLSTTQRVGVSTAMQNLASHAAVASAPSVSAALTLPAIQPLQAPQPAVHVQAQMLGEHFFLLIKTMHYNLAGKIMGILLELDHTELLHMLESLESLCTKVDKAMAGLQAHHARKEIAQKVGAVATATS